MNLRSGAAVGQGVLQKGSRAQFEDGLDLIFSKWTALQLAVDQEWGGRNSKTKAEEMVNEVIDWFYRKKTHDIFELEPLLETIMLEDFNVQAEDGSPGQVGQSLLQWYEQCLQNDFSMLERLRSVPNGAQASCGQAVDNDGAAMVMDADDGDSSSSGSSDDENNTARQTNGVAGHDRDGQDAMDEDALPAQSAQPAVDDDGFQLVQRGRRRR